MSNSPEQQKIVDHPVTEHAVVLAVAGSGKSYTMTERIGYLVEAKRVDPSAIIAVMFNRTAMEEFSERLEKRLGKRLAPKSATFHQMGSICLKWLVNEGLIENWKFEANEYEALRFCTNVLSGVCRTKGYNYPRMVAEVFLGFVDRVKSDLKPPQEVFEAGNWASHFNWFPAFFKVYEQARAAAKVRFFSDLIYDPVMAVEASEKAARCLADRYEHIIIDEFQDICEAQYRMMRYVAGKKARVMVVGDDDQTIYTWRGAQPHYILSGFAKDYEGAHVYRLTRTWRYGHALSCAASYVISHNVNRYEKLCVSSPHTPQTSVQLHWQEGEVDQVIKIVNEWLGSGRLLSEVAVLVRTYSKSFASQFAMLNTGIPFRLEGGDDVSVLDNEWIASLLVWLEIAAGRFAHRPYAGDPDSGSIFKMRRILMTPALKVTRELAQQIARDLLINPKSLVAFNNALGSLAGPAGTLHDRISRRAKVWREIQTLTTQNVDALEVVDLLINRLNIIEEIKQVSSKQDDAAELIELVHAFRRYVEQSEHTGLSEFLNHIADLKAFSERAKKQTVAVLMTSIHRSKGLEWPCVIMPQLIDGAFPHIPRSKSEREDMEGLMEDERRLFYVAMTRAREQLHMIAPPDPQLSNWLRAGRSGTPKTLEEEGVIASRFLYESNLYLSSLMPRMIEQPRGIKAADPELFNQYLSELGIKVRIPKLEIQSE